MPVSHEQCRLRLLEELRLLSKTDQTDPFADLVTGTEDSPEQILGYDPAVHEEALATLKDVCRVFKLKISPQTLDVEAPKSGVVIVQGARGAGKTTLLHRLRHEMPECLILRPTSWRSNRRFPHYLLQELVFELERRGQRTGQLMLQNIARRLAGEILYQLLNAFTDVGWLREHARWSGYTGWRRKFHEVLPLWGIGTAQGLALRKALLERLAPEKDGYCDLASLFPEYRGSVEGLYRLALDHIQRSEKTIDLQGVIRAGLYRRIVELAFAPIRFYELDAARREARIAGAKLATLDYLLEGYTREYRGILPAPELAVDALLRALMSLLVFQGIPIIVTLDALDTRRMLGDPPDPVRIHQFFSELGDFLDNYPGVGFIIFCEVTHWSETSKFRSDQAKQRIQQGILVPNRGPVTDCTLKELDSKLLRDILRRRLGPVHNLLQAAVPQCRDALTDLFPFQPNVLHALFGDRPPSLRQALFTLRTEYIKCITLPADPAPPSDVVPVPAPPEDPNRLTRLYEEKWSQLLSETDESTENNMSGLANNLHEALDEWLRIPGFSAQGWTVTKTDPRTFGATTYEQLTMCWWSRNGDSHVCAIGFLLGFGPGLSNDVRKKGAILPQLKKDVRSAVLLWPTVRYDDQSPPYSDHLPGGTKVAWDKASIPAYVRLQAIPRDAVVKWLAASQWLDQVSPLTDQVHAPEMHRFLLDKTTDLVAYIQPK